MTIEIIDYRPDQKESIQGRFDIKIALSGGRYRIYRNLIHWNKNDKEWITPPNAKINEEYVKIIEFDKDTAMLFYKSCLEALKLYLQASTVDTKEEKLFDF